MVLMKVTKLISYNHDNESKSKCFSFPFPNFAFFSFLNCSFHVPLTKKIYFMTYHIYPCYCLVDNGYYLQNILEHLITPSVKVIISKVIT